MSERQISLPAVGGRGRGYLALALVAAVLGLCSAGPAAADTIIAIAPHTGQPGSTTVFSIQTSPFTVSTVGTVPNQVLSGLTFQPGTGALFASSGLQGNNPGTVFTINPSTGAATPLPMPTGSQGVTGLAFSLDGKTLYGAGGTNGPGTELITINTTTGQGTPVGPFGIQDQIASLAVDPRTGLLYGGNANNDGEIYLINPSTGTATPFVTLNGPTSFGDASGANITGLAFDSAGNLFASLIIVSDDSPLGPVSLRTGAFTQLGTPGNPFLSDIAIAGPLATPAVPEPGTLGLLGLGVLGLLGYRRRAAARAAGG